MVIMQTICLFILFCIVIISFVFIMLQIEKLFKIYIKWKKKKKDES